jgi:hypothetical protein
MATGTISRTDGGACAAPGSCTGHVACIINNDLSQGIRILCSGQSPQDNSIPFHVSLNYQKALRPGAYIGGTGYAVGLGPGNIVVQGRGSGSLELIDYSTPSAPTVASRLRTQDIGGALSFATSGNYVIYATGGYGGFAIVDISDTSHPVMTSYTSCGDYSCDSLAVSGNYLFISTTNNGLLVFDISNKSAPTQLNSSNALLTGGYSASDMKVVGNYLYVADQRNGLDIIDISTPASPTHVGNFQTDKSGSNGGTAYGDATGLDVVGGYAYVAAYQEGLYIIDVSNPAAPTQAGVYTNGDYAWTVRVNGNYAYLANYNSGLEVIDVSNKAAPTLAGNYPDQRYTAVQYSGGKAFMGSGRDGLHIIDVSAPATPTLLGAVKTNGLPQHVSFYGNYAYVVDDSYYGTDNVFIYDVTDPRNASVLGSIHPAQGSISSSNVTGTRLYVSQCYNGLAIYDLTDPTSPSLVTRVTGSYDCLERMATNGNYLYATNGSTGMKSFQVLGGAPAEVGSLALGSQARDIKVSGSYAYVAMDGGIAVVDISTPASPSVAATYATTNPVYSLDLVGTTLYAASGNTGLIILDISTPASPSLAGTQDISGDARAVSVSGNHAYLGVFCDRVSAVNIVDPANTAMSGSANYIPGCISTVKVNGDYIWAAFMGGGLQILGKIPD